MSQKKVIVTKKRQQYSSQFREQALARAKKEGVPKAAKDLGIHGVTSENGKNCTLRNNEYS